jgi:alanine racemase
VNNRPAWAEVDLDAIAHNARVLAAAAAPAGLCAVVKADGYGHGAEQSARAARRGGASSVAVALASEGAELRADGFEEPIMVLSQASSGEVEGVVADRLEPSLYTHEAIAELSRTAVAAGRHDGDPVLVHLKVDTGMHRVGCRPSDAVDLARAIEAAPALRLASLFTHFAVADEPGNPFTDVQFACYRSVLADLEAAGIEVPCRHVANTAALMDHPETHLDLVRCGMGLYGLPPSPAMADRLDLRPAMALKSRVSYVKRVPAGEPISYGLHYVPDRETTIATVPIGYADGIPRIISHIGGRVLIHGRHHPVAGTITMDQLTVDCGDEPVEAGDEVVLLGEQDGARIDAQEWATLAGTITYEILCAISSRVPRRYLEAPR